MGYYGTITPSVILRNLFENPSWYTPYTPYQAEIAQGRLESLLNFQTMVRDLTAMEIATASLLDEATAAGEAMTLLHRVQARQATGARNTFWVSERTYPQVLDVLKGRAEPLGITIVFGDPASAQFSGDVFGAYVQSPDDYGALVDLRAFIERAHEQHVLVAVGSDLLALTITRAPRRNGRGRGRRQRATVWRADGLWRPSRGVSRDARNVRQAGAGPHHRRIGRRARQSSRTAWRCRRASSTSGARRRPRTSAPRRRCSRISPRCMACTTGPTGLRRLRSARTRSRPRSRPPQKRSVIRQQNDAYFDTLRIQVPDGIGETTVGIKAIAERAGLNFRYFDSPHIGIALDETTTLGDVLAIAAVLAEAAGKPVPRITNAESAARSADRARAKVGVHDAPGVLGASLGNEDDAVSEEPRAQGCRSRSLDDSAWLVHDEVERGVRDDPGHVAGVFRDSSVRPARPGAGLRAGHQRARTGARRNHRVRRGVAAAQLRRAGRARRPDGHSRVSPFARRREARRRADSSIGARDESRQRGDGRAQSRRRRNRRERQHRCRRSEGEGGTAPRSRWRR